MKERQPIRKVVAKTVPYDKELDRAARNFEIYWRKGQPMNEFRVHTGLPIVTKEELAKKRDKAFKK